jgi:hypothetical protein
MDQALHFRGSLARLFTSRQAGGAYKCCSNVFTSPQRNIGFDPEFL